MGESGVLSGYEAASEPDRVALLDRLALAAASGQPGALDDLLALVDRHQLARGSIRRLIVDDAEFDDVNQDVLIRVAKGITSFRGDARFTTWLHTIGRNTAIDHLRRRKDTEPLDDEAMSDRERISSMIASRADLRSVFDGLPDHYREIVTLRDVEGRTYADIAEDLGIELNTVRSRLARGRALVAERLERP
ncbi:MAG: sigma-70 family RNA polymerase sigma factor [Actinomycetota bacterium]